MRKIIGQLLKSQVGFPFDSHQVELSTEIPLITQLNETFACIHKTYLQDEELEQVITSVWKGGQFLLEIAPLYDYDASTHANGYWSFAKLIIKFGKVMQIASSEDAFNREQAFHVLEILNTGLAICYKIRRKESYNNDELKEDHLSIKGVDLVEEGSLFASKLDIVDLLALIKSLKKQLSFFYAYFNSCWLSPSISHVMQYFSAFMAIYSSQWKSLKIYNWINRQNRGTMLFNMSLGINIDCLQSMWNMTEYRVARQFMIRHDKSQILTKSIYAKRQSRWKVAMFEGKVYDQTVPCQQVRFGRCVKSTVRCLLLRSLQREHPSSNLTLHLHGGGYISQSPEFHQVYLNEWAKTLKDTTILSVDYSLSPEAPYPEALQEVLDCYLWLVSGDPEVEAAIGFHPTKIAICGDSAGGNLGMALVLALNDIRQTVKQYGGSLDGYPFPSGLFCFYTPFILNTFVSPARIITSVEGLIPVGTLLSCLAAYVPQEVMNEDHPTQGESDEMQLVPNNITSMVQLLYSKVVWGIKSALSVVSTNYRLVPWYKKPDSVKQSLYNLNKFVSNPFISPLLSKDIDFDEVPLYLYPLTYDAFLDDSIEMAKKWKGKVYIEVFDELPHGFLNLIAFCDKAKEASDRCIEHIMDVFG